MNPSDWTPTDGLELEPHALQAVTEVHNNIIVSAGPGTGKTELLAQRADFLFRTKSVPYPKRILAISFKDDAAKNLRERVRGRTGAIYANRFDSMTYHAFAKMLVDNYRLVLKGRYRLGPDYEIDEHQKKIRDTNFRPNITTFNQFLIRANKIIRSNQYALSALRQTYSHVFLDEFQDTTNDQYELVKLAFHDTDILLTAVGDSKQSIMTWAGALKGVMQDFADDFAAEQLHILRNFRSLPNLKRAQDRIIKLFDPSIDIPDTPPCSGEGNIIVKDFSSDNEEADYIANQVESWMAQGTKPKEIAILIRQQPNYIGQPLMRELQSRGIAYRDEQSLQRLLTEPLAELILNFLRVVTLPSAPDAYIYLKNFASSVSQSEVSTQKLNSKLSEFIRQSTKSTQSTNFDDTDPKQWVPLLHGFLNLIPESNLRSLSGAYQQGDYMFEVEDQVYDAFFNELRLDNDPANALRRLSGEDSIRILTIHKCKGLEFEKVIILGVEKELFWSRSKDYIPKTKIPKEILSLFFAAVSRAKNELILTHVDKRERPHDLRPDKDWDEERAAYDELINLVSRRSEQNEPSIDDELVF